ncbi:MAG: class I SAM-dependent methyltransferase [Sporolactobacillus sp.]|jgi:16S rRNA (guanine1207-N2)-methyltransferase|nr:class I SAM-dependent methyltransferase [Sporolactobacillus sp.]MCI1881361.1 class I SAM-dependent methyltransferase [Sporolactobacillus sp.]
MNDHYYSNRPQAQSHPRQITARLRGQLFSFITDAGVFSKSGVDFGSALLIETFRQPQIPGAILDIGCGYGPIGLTLGRIFPDRSIVMTDVNERAVHLAQENARVNRVAARVIQSDLYEQVIGRFAAVVTNPPIRAGKQTVHRMLRGAYDRLDHGGELWTVIRKKQGAPSALALLREVFDAVDIAARKKGYHVLFAKKI